MRIAYPGLFRFPDGNAGAFHVLGVGKALREYGHSAIFLGVEKSPGPEQRVPGTAWTGHGPSYAGFRYRSVDPNGTALGRLKQSLSMATGSSFLRRLNVEEESNGPIDAVIVYHPESLWIFRLLNWCRPRRIPLICDVVEWFDRSHVKGGRYGYRALDSEFRMRRGHLLCDGVLAISTYLENYYSSRGMATLRMPNLVDLSEEKWSQGAMSAARTGGTKLRLAFVGTAERKDLLVNAIRGLSMVEAGKCDIVAVGPSKEELRVNLGPDSILLEALHEELHFRGRLRHHEALRELVEADFSILLRPDAQYANAGFPTKLVESLAMGVPVLCNLTGDVGLYVKDGQEGIVVPDCSPEAFAEGVRRILAMPMNQRLAMRSWARRRAEESFDYRNWVAHLGEFIDRVTANVRQKNPNGRTRLRPTV